MSMFSTCFFEEKRDGETDRGRPMAEIEVAVAWRKSIISLLLFIRYSDQQHHCQNKVGHIDTFVVIARP